MLIIDRRMLSSSTLTEYEGRDSEAGTSLIFVDLSRDGDGPDLHWYPYSETFIIIAGEAELTIGSEVLRGIANQVVIVPPLTPHRFVKRGLGRLQMIDVHASDRFITEWL